VVKSNAPKDRNKSSRLVASDLISVLCRVVLPATEASELCYGDLLTATKRHVYPQEQTSPAPTDRPYKKKRAYREKRGWSEFLYLLKNLN